MLGRARNADVIVVSIAVGIRRPDSALNLDVGTGARKRPSAGSAGERAQFVPGNPALLLVNGVVSQLVAAIVCIAIISGGQCVVWRLIAGVVLRDPLFLVTV